MCSIEEAWAGQNFDGKKVVSQGDLHNSYMGLPDNIFYRENEITTKRPKQEPLKNLPRGINSKYSREPRVPKIVRNTNNAELNISSEMPEIKNYGGLEPLPSFMSIYNNSNSNSNSNNNQPKMNQSYTTNQSYPRPVMTGEQFTDIENAYNVSDTLSHFMNTDSNLLDEDNDDDRSIINNKFANMNTRNSFNNVDKKSRKHNNNNDNNNNNNNDNNNNNNNNNTYNDLEPDIRQLLHTIIKKIDSIENQLSNYNNKNVYDLILYIIIGILFSFCIYSVFNKKNK